MVKYLALEVKEEIGLKEDPTSHAKGGGKNEEENLRKQKKEVEKWERMNSRAKGGEQR